MKKILVLLVLCLGSVFSVACTKQDKLAITNIACVSVSGGKIDCTGVMDGVKYIANSCAMKYSLQDGEFKIKCDSWGIAQK